MFMNSNGPVSIRCARTERLAGSAVRSDTQLHTWPPCSGSGWVVRRNRTVSPARSRISALAYSVKSSGQCSTSFILSHTWSIGAEMTIALSTRGTGYLLDLREVSVDVGERVGQGHDPFSVLIRDREAVVLLDRELHLDDGERVEAEIDE